MPPGNALARARSAGGLPIPGQPGTGIWGANRRRAVGMEHLVQVGPLILAAPIAAAAGALTFLSPCVLPLVPATSPT